jgi:DNA helicase-2/ATP-dependent DNA helicase PcrA
VVVAAGANPPPAWSDAERFVIDVDLLGDPDALLDVVNTVQVRYMKRIPGVYELTVRPDALRVAEHTDAAPYELGATFSFLRERLTKLIWHNSYDARSDQLMWWWAQKAAVRFNATAGGPADVLLESGEPAWVDGGPRQPLDLDGAVVHHESVELGRFSQIPPLKVPEADLAPDQLEAVSHLVGPARVIAPAGSGKTRVLTARVRHLLEDRGIEPDLLTALAYNRRAAAEMVERLPAGESLNVRTIHSIGWEILRMARPHLRLIGEAEQRRRLAPIAKALPRPNTDVIGPYLEALDEVRIGLRHPEDVEAGRDDVPEFAKTFQLYRDHLNRDGEADHAEQIYGAIEALCRLPDLRAFWQARCRHLLVDEFQDLTPAYLLLIRLLAGPGMSVFGVGDDDQVIYGYAGADPGYLIDFEDLFPGAAAYALEVNYRCPGDVVGAAINLVSYNRRRVYKKILSNAAHEGLEVATAPGDELAAAAVNRVEEFIDGGVEAGSTAILARVNSSLLPVHVALSERGIPHDSLLSPAILERTVLRAALAWIRIALKPHEMRRDDLFEAVRRPGRGLTRLLGEMIGRRRGPMPLDELIAMGERLDGRRQDRWFEFCDDIGQASEACDSTSRLLSVLSTEIGLDRAAAALDSDRSQADRSGHGDDLTALRRCAALGPEPADFERWLRERLAQSSNKKGVLLSSIHRVKGQEWDQVILFGVDRGSMPHQLAEDLEEERRVFHVALTRGRRTVMVLADRERPSRFLSELSGTAPRPVESPPERVDRPAANAPRDGIHVALGDVVGITGGYRAKVDEILATGVLVKVSETGATMAVPWGERISKGGLEGRLAPGIGSGDPRLVERLRAWRLDQARSQGVPAFVVFNDRTLQALASVRPSTSEGLLDVPGIGPGKLEAYGEELLELLTFD